MPRNAVLQILMAMGFVVGLVGIVRHIIYNLSLFGFTKPANFMTIQFALYGTFGAIFLICFVLKTI
jgi:hypothetical protein